MSVALQIGNFDRISRKIAAERAFPPKTLEEAVMLLDQRFTTHGQIGDSSLAPTGEPYVIIVSGGIRAEGERSPLFAAFESVAIDLWWESVNEYAKDKTGTIYWREMPEINSMEFVSLDLAVEYASGTIKDDHPFWQPTQLWNVYSRLLISDKPA